MNGTKHCSIFVLPTLHQEERTDLRLLVLPDGNTRAQAADGGYTTGASKVVTISEHLALRTNVTAMVACILSKENITKRGEPFFANLRDQFIRLGAAIETQGALIKVGIRLDLCGDLDAMRAHGGCRLALADSIEAVIAKTKHIVAPRFQLFFGIGYSENAPSELGIDVIFRTGMEEEGVFRLSGLRPREGTVCIASTKLWPQIEPSDVDTALAKAARCQAGRLAAGQPPPFITEVIAELSRAALGVPTRATVLTDAPTPALIMALDRLFARRNEDLSAVAVAVHGGAGAADAPRWYGRPAATSHEIHIVPSAFPCIVTPHAAYDSFLAPGQTSSALVLPYGLPIGYANVHACGTHARDVVEAMRAAAQFLQNHPPLIGAERRPGLPPGAEHDVFTDSHRHLAQAIHA